MSRIKVDTPLARVLAARSGRWLTAQLEDYQEKQKDRKPDPGWFHPSGLAINCDAGLAFQYLGVPTHRQMSARTRRILDNGHNRDIATKSYLKGAGLSLITKPEQRFVTIPELHIRGELDDLIRNPLTKEKYIFEFKTINSGEFKTLTAPKPAHVIQVHPYMYGYGIQQAYFLYECKDNQEYKEFVVRFDAGIWANIVARTNSILKSLATGTLPARMPIQAESQCGFLWTCAAFDLREYMRNADEYTRQNIIL